MKIVKVKWSISLLGCEQEEILFFEDENTSNEDIEHYVREMIWEDIRYEWSIRPAPRNCQTGCEKSPACVGH